MLRHIVIWTLRDPADAPRFKTLLDSCRALVPGIEEFDVGIRSAGLEANADVVLVSGFTEAAALDAYQQHPHHQGVKAELVKMAAGRHVIDFYS